MKRIALLEYKFILDENVPWRNLSSFEDTLIKFFDSIGINADMVEVKGNSSEKVIYLERKDVPIQAPPIVNKVMTFKKGK